ncbi:hypothetical protein [Devosia geojensis]|uniref:hypothetical protein n=1 Tax=Devosia geojensis TaxID=443610 RepID=UPI001FCCE59D|nr:hypothetical protein [Devosia geojensis]
MPGKEADAELGRAELQGEEDGIALGRELVDLLAAEHAFVEGKGAAHVGSRKHGHDP